LPRRMSSIASSIVARGIVTDFSILPGLVKQSSRYATLVSSDGKSNSLAKVVERAPKQ
jgi:hypothetical protein